MCAAKRLLNLQVDRFFLRVFNRNYYSLAWPQPPPLPSPQYLLPRCHAIPLRELPPFRAEDNPHILDNEANSQTVVHVILCSSTSSLEHDDINFAVKKCCALRFLLRPVKCLYGCIIWEIHHLLLPNTRILTFFSPIFAFARGAEVNYLNMAKEA